MKLRHRLRRSGLRATAPRISVLRLLLSADRPLSHSEVVERLGPGGHDAATVYRNLNDLAEAGLAARMDLGDHVWRYEARGRSRREGHAHALCTSCGAIRCLPPDRLPVVRRALPSDWVAASTAVLHGVCGRCVRDGRPRPRRRP